MILRALALSLLCLMTATFSGSAFVVYGPADAKNALDNLERAPRWALTDETLLSDGERGLGGGLEYSIDDSVCQLRFVDDAACDDVRAAIRLALEAWASGHPVIAFSDVTVAIAPAIPIETSGQQHFGAEIDFFAADRFAFPTFSDSAITGHTIFYERSVEDLKLANDTTTPAKIGRIESADVRFNSELCFYIDVRSARPDCVHFPSVVLHEMSHVLGIGHPEEAPDRNLDTDRIAGNRIEIDCNDPLSGLRASRRIDGAAVAHGQDVQGHGRYVRGLTWDDVAARDALYPNCAIKPLPRFSRQWGAFALGQDGSEGRARLFRDEKEAGAIALAECETTGVSCVLMETFDNCFALAVSPTGGLGIATSHRTDLARTLALSNCSAGGGSCQLKADFCAFETERR